MRDLKELPEIDLDEELKRFFDFREPEPDIRALDLMFQQFTCSSEVFFEDDRANAWLLYKSLRDLLVLKQDRRKQEGGENE